MIINILRYSLFDIFRLRGRSYFLLKFIIYPHTMFAFNIMDCCAEILHQKKDYECIACDDLCAFKRTG